MSLEAKDDEKCLMQKEIHDFGIPALDSTHQPSLAHTPNYETRVLPGMSYDTDRHTSDSVS